MTSGFPIWQRQISPEGRLVVPHQEQSLAEAFGAGLSGFGQTLDQFASQQEDARRIVQQRDDAAWIGQEKPQALLKLSPQIQGLEDGAPEGAAGHADQVAKVIDGYTADVLARAPDDATRAEMQSYLGSLKAGYLDDAARFQKASEIALRGMKIDTAATYWGDVLVHDPAQRDAAQAAMQKTIADQGLPPDKAAAFQDQMAKTLDAYAVAGQANVNPDQFVKDVDAGKFDGKADPQTLLDLKNQAQVAIQRRAAEQQRAATEARLLQQADMTTRVDTASNSAIANGGQIPVVNGKPTVTPDQVRKAVPGEDGEALAQHLEFAVRKGQFAQEIAGTTAAEDAQKIAALRPKPGESQTPEQADMLAFAEQQIAAKQQQVQTEVAQDIQDSVAESQQAFATHGADWLNIAGVTGKVPDEAYQAIADGFPGADGIRLRQQFDTQAELGRQLQQVRQGTLPEDRKLLGALHDKAQAGGAGSGTAAEEERALTGAIDDKWRAIRNDPAGYVIGKYPRIGQAWQQFNDLLGKKDPGADAAGKRAVAATLQQQRDIGLRPEALQPLPKEQAAALATDLRSLPPELRSARAKQIVALGPEALGQVIAAGAPAETAAFAAVTDTVWNAKLAGALSSTREQLDAKLPAAMRRTDVIDKVKEDLADFFRTMPAANADIYQQSIADVAIMNLHNGMRIDAAIADATKPFHDGWVVDGYLRAPAGSKMANIKVGLAQTVRDIIGGEPPFDDIAAIPSGLPGRGAPQDRAVLLKNLQDPDNYRWITNETGDGAILTLASGRSLATADGNRIVVSFADAARMGARLPRQVGARIWPTQGQ